MYGGNLVEISISMKKVNSSRIDAAVDKDIRRI
jgi:hypothetical protein